MQKVSNIANLNQISLVGDLW